MLASQVLQWPLNMALLPGCGVSSPNLGGAFGCSFRRHNALIQSTCQLSTLGRSAAHTWEVGSGALGCQVQRLRRRVLTSGDHSLTEALQNRRGRPHSGRVLVEHTVMTMVDTMGVLPKNVYLYKPMYWGPVFRATYHLWAIRTTETEKRQLYGRGDDICHTM